MRLRVYTSTSSESIWMFLQLPLRFVSPVRYSMLMGTTNNPSSADHENLESLPIRFAAKASNSHHQQRRINSSRSTGPSIRSPYPTLAAGHHHHTRYRMPALRGRLGTPCNNREIIIQLAANVHLVI